MATNTPNYNVNYDDERFTQVETEKQQALTDLEQTYGGMISESDKYYQAQIDASKEWADKQSQLQQEQTDFTIEQVEQQKDQAHKDYLKEQSGAYVDWQKQSNQYGANAEQMAANGMTNTGFSESSQVSMYNTYQNRVATARESFNQAVLNYNNAIKEARLQNSSILAEIAQEALQTQLELSLQGFQYKNNLILEQANKKLEVDQMYYNRWQDVLGQINTENAMAEDVRQFNESMALQKQQLEEEIRQFNQSYQLQKSEFEESIRQFNEEIARLKAKDAQEYELEIKNLELKKEQLEEQKRQWEAEMAEEKRQFDKEYAAKYGSGSKTFGGAGYQTLKSQQATAKSTIAKNTTSQKPSTTDDSIAALGYGPLTPAGLADLMAAGKVGRTWKNGQWHYYRITASGPNRLKNMGLSY